MFRKITDAVVRFLKEYLPSSYWLALILTLIVFLYAAIFTDTPLEKVAQLLDGNSDFLLEYLRRFGDTAPVSAYVMTKTDIEAVLSFLEQHDRFCTADLQRALQLGYHSAAPLIQWMKEADYIKREEGGFYSRKGREA